MFDTYSVRHSVKYYTRLLQVVVKMFVYVPRESTWSIVPCPIISGQGTTVYYNMYLAIYYYVHICIWYQKLATVRRYTSSIIRYKTYTGNSLRVLVFIYYFIGIRSIDYGCSISYNGRSVQIHTPRITSSFLVIILPHANQSIRVYHTQLRAFRGNTKRAYTSFLYT